jgi:hypothetical protein
MRLLVIGAAVALLALATHRALGEPALPDAPPTVQRTTSAGTVPSIEGHWLVLVRLGTAQAGGRQLAALWDVTRGAAGIEVSERFVRLPEPQRTALARGGFDPNQADLRAIAQAWDNLEPDGRGVREVQTDVFGEDGFTAEVKGDPTATGARWVARQAYLFAPGIPRPAREVNVLAATSIDDGVWRGRYLSVTVAAAPVPIPIRLEGTFQLIPLSSPSWWARLLDVFRGCNPGGRSDP